jgi:phosphocarrier protein HPr
LLGLRPRRCDRDLSGPDSGDGNPALHSSPLVVAVRGKWTFTETNGPSPVGPTSPGSLVPRPTEPPMSHDPPIVCRKVEILNRLGLHMRPADRFVKLALQYQSDIRVIYNGHEFNGKSILDLTSVAAECGTQLVIEARGPDAAAAIVALADLIAAQFYEDDEGNLEKEPAP